MDFDLRGKRPFPIDNDRKERCLKVLEDNCMTITELAIHLGVSKSHISEVISGRRLSDAYEKNIASFFGLPREALFPVRTNYQINELRIAEEEAKKIAEEKKAKRMALRQKYMNEVA